MPCNFLIRDRFWKKGQEVPGFDWHERKGYLRSSRSFESQSNFFPHPKERGKEAEENNLGFLGFPDNTRNVIYLDKETKFHHGLQQRWHSHSDAALVVSIRPLTAPRFCQCPSEDWSSGKRSKLVPEGVLFCFFFPWSSKHAGKKTSGPEAELCPGRFSHRSKRKPGLSTSICTL